MSKSLADLKVELEENVPARNGVPSSDQYERAIKSAANDFADLSPLRKQVTLTIVSGTQTYTLPDDFVRIIQLVDFPQQDGTLVTNAGLVPLSDQIVEEYAVVDKELVFYPVPQYDATRYLWYASGYVLDADDIYQDMDDRSADMVMLKAQAIALRWQANKAAQESWQYQMGDERVNKEKLAQALNAQAEKFEKDYMAAIKEGRSQVMKRSHRDLL